MQYNECKTCGAKDGRAGMLFNSEFVGSIEECKNCYDTRRTGVLTMHSNLNRTKEEFDKTANILERSCKCSSCCEECAMNI